MPVTLNADEMGMHPYQLLEQLKRDFWAHFGGSKTWRSRLKKKQTLAILKQYAEYKIAFKTLQPLKHRRKKFNEVKGELHQLRSHKLCFACGDPAEHRHHIILLNHGGDNSKRNVVSLCAHCHAEIHPWMKAKVPKIPKWATDEFNAMKAELDAELEAEGQP